MEVAMVLAVLISRNGRIQLDHLHLSLPRYTYSENIHASLSVTSQMR